jgi:hypothetical protein
MEWTTIEGPNPVYEMARELYMNTMTDKASPLSPKAAAGIAIAWSIEFHRQWQKACEVKEERVSERSYATPRLMTTINYTKTAGSPADVSMKNEEYYPDGTRKPAASSKVTPAGISIMLDEMACHLNAVYEYLASLTEGTRVELLFTWHPQGDEEELILVTTKAGAEGEVIQLGPWKARTEDVLDILKWVEGEYPEE